MNRPIKIHVFLFILFCLVCLNQTYGQEYLRRAEHREQNPAAARVAFNQIENGIASGRVSELVEYLSPQTYLSLSNGISGYYSSNQAYYVLEDFFRSYQVTGFRFDDLQIEEGNVYGTGKYQFVMRGKREVAQVYISLKHAGKKWKITQLTIN